MIAGTPFVIVDVDDAWPGIAHRLVRTRSSDATVSRIRMRCVAGEAVCLQCPDGIVIVSIAPEDGGTIVATVLLAVSLGLQGAFKEYERSVLALARDMGASVLAFETDRLGWRRLLGPEWHERDGVFRRAVG